MSFPELIDALRAFRDERDWAQFHTPQHLATALSIEVSELQELMLWKDAGEVEELAASKSGHGLLSDELSAECCGVNRKSHVMSVASIKLRAVCRVWHVWLNISLSADRVAAPVLSG